MSYFKHIVMSNVEGYPPSWKSPKNPPGFWTTRPVIKVSKMIFRFWKHYPYFPGLLLCFRTSVNRLQRGLSGSFSWSSFFIRWIWDSGRVEVASSSPPSVSLNSVSARESSEFETTNDQPWGMYKVYWNKQWLLE
jgi:hypothetical protein